MVGYYLAQFESITGEGTTDPSFALEILNRSVQVNQETFDSWNDLWRLGLSPDTGLWQAVVQIGLLLAGLSVFYLVVTDVKEAVVKQDFYGLVKVMVLPLVVLLFLGNNGFLLSNMIKTVRVIASDQVNTIAEISIGDTFQGVSLQDAQDSLNLTNAALEEIQLLYSECDGLTGEDLELCWSNANEKVGEIATVVENQQPPNKIAQAFRSVVNNLVQGNGLYALVNFKGFAEYQAQKIIRALLYGLQWAFVNTVEAALLLTALFLPISIGISMVSLSQQVVVANVVGFLALYGVQIAYNLTIGLVSLVMTNTVGSLFNELGFSMFISLFGPILAVSIASGGGLSLYQSINSGVGQLVDFASDLASLGVRISR